MNETEKELFRNAILMALDRASHFGMPLSTVHQGTMAADFRAGVDEVKAELDYLEDKTLVRVESAPLSAGLKRYRLSAQGIDYLESRHLR